MRQTKASRFGRMSSQEANYISKTSANETEEEMEVVVEETANHEDVSLFVDLEAYRGQDDRQAKSLGTPGLLKPSHYILADGKVNLHESLLIFCVFTQSCAIFLLTPVKKSSGKAPMLLLGLTHVISITVKVEIWCHGVSITEY